MAFLRYTNSVDWRPFAFYGLYFVALAIWLKWLCEWSIDKEAIRRAVFWWSLPISIALFFFNLWFWISPTTHVGLELFVVVCVLMPFGCALLVPVVGFFVSRSSRYR